MNNIKKKFSYSTELLERTVNLIRKIVKKLYYTVIMKQLTKVDCLCQCNQI